MSFNNADHLLRGHAAGTCSWEAKSADSYNAATGDQTETFASAVTLNCMQASPSMRWIKAYPELVYQQAIELWLPKDCGVTVEDRITFAGQQYRVIAIDPWAVINRVALCERWGTDD